MKKQDLKTKNQLFQFGVGGGVVVKVPGFGATPLKAYGFVSYTLLFPGCLSVFIN